MTILEYSEWKHFCETAARRSFGSFRWFYGNDRFVSKYQNALDIELSRILSDESTQYPLYMAMGYFFCIEKLGELTTEDDTIDAYYASIFYKEKSDEILKLFKESMLEYLELDHEEEDRFSGETLLNLFVKSEDVLNDVRTCFILETTKDTFDFSARDYQWHVYLWVWQLSTPEMREKEIRRLQKRGFESGSRELTLYLQSMDLSAGQLTDLIDEFTEQSFIRLKEILEVSIFSDRMAFSKVIVEWILRKDTSYLSYLSQWESMRVVRSLCALMELYGEELSSDVDLHEAIIMHFMPKTAEEYGEILFRKGDYRKWAELHSALGNNALYTNRNEVKVIAKEEPEVLLALYHQQIAFEIRGRNRQSYQAAVRLLKKLRAIYKKQKDTDTWDLYCMNLVEKHKRLRAFQEELKRGTIIETTTDKN